ncbi:MAG: guanylate kinase [Proteobacteria bacterium]|nr:guanylate kinase [Pseudomonadota bacterium]
MLVLSSPSGAGKTTISRALLEQDSNIFMSVSATTRPKRPGEVDGKDYIFVGEDEFQSMIDRGELLEHARVFGHMYGTPRAKVLDALNRGIDVLFDIDWQGTQQLGNDGSTEADLVTVFILPPNSKELENRLHRRARDPEEVVRHRMEKAADEMSHYREYSYIIINDDIDESVGEVQSILRAERLRRERQLGLHEFVQGLHDGA